MCCGFAYAGIMPRRSSLDGAVPPVAPPVKRAAAPPFARLGTLQPVMSRKPPVVADSVARAYFFAGRALYHANAYVAPQSAAACAARRQRLVDCAAQTRATTFSGAALRAALSSSPDDAIVRRAISQLLRAGKNSPKSRLTYTRLAEYASLLIDAQVRVVVDALPGAPYSIGVAAAAPLRRGVHLPALCGHFVLLSEPERRWLARRRTMISVVEYTKDPGMSPMPPSQRASLVVARQVDERDSRAARRDESPDPAPVLPVAPNVFVECRKLLTGPLSLANMAVPHDGRTLRHFQYEGEMTINEEENAYAGWRAATTACPVALGEPLLLDYGPKYDASIAKAQQAAAKRAGRWSVTAGLKRAAPTAAGTAMKRARF